MNPWLVKIRQDSNGWAVLRGTFLGLGALAIVFDSPMVESTPASSTDWVVALFSAAVGFGFALIPPFFESLASRTSTWRTPGWRRSPFALANPLQFPWFAGRLFVLLAGAAGIGSLARGALFAGEVLPPLLFGGGLLVGIAAARWIFGRRFVAGGSAG